MFNRLQIFESIPKVEVNSCRESWPVFEREKIRSPEWKEGNKDVR